MLKISHVTEATIPGLYKAELTNNDDIYQYEGYVLCEAFQGAFGPLKGYSAIYKKGDGIPLYSKWYDGCIIKNRFIAQKVLADLVDEFNHQSS